MLTHKLTVFRLLYGLSFPMSEAAQKDDFVIPVSPYDLDLRG